MTWLAYGLAALAIVTMAANVMKAAALRRAIVGGEVGEKWSALTALIAFFFAAYLFSPLSLWLDLPAQWLHVIMFSVFLGGAVFVFVVIGIIKDVLGFLKLLK